MEGFPKHPVPANDNTPNVVAFTGERKAVPDVETLNTAKITSMRAHLSEYTLSPTEMKTYEEQYGSPTVKEIIAHVNTSTEQDWNARPQYFAFLLASLSAPRMSEVADD